MEKWILWWILLVVVNGDDPGSEGNIDRYRRSEDCDHAATFTIENTIRLIEQIERKHTSWDFTLTTNVIRVQGYKSYQFDALCGMSIDFLNKELDIPGLTTAELRQLRNMVIHRFVDETTREIGVVNTTVGTVAFGHVLTGICAGLRRDFNFIIPQLDNLHAATAAGDLGQTCVHTKCKLGRTPGTWDNSTCPMIFSVTENETGIEATYAEMLGDIHGFILGLLVPQIKPTKLSIFLKEFYLEDGLDSNGKFHVSKSAELFKEAVSVSRLKFETQTFHTVYALSKLSNPFITDKKINAVVQEFFNHDVMRPCNKFPETHKISYFINLIQTLEKQSEYDLSTMLKALCSSYSFAWAGPASSLQNGLRLKRLHHYYYYGDSKRQDGFEWYIASESMSTLIDTERMVYNGVFEDNIGVTLSISITLLEVYHGIVKGSWFFGMIDPLSLAQKYRLSGTSRLGKPGRWESGCPKQHHIDSISIMHYADYISVIDGIILAKVVKQYIEDNQQPKLSKLLSEYYSERGLNKQEQIRSSKRFEHIDRILKEMSGKKKKRQVGSSIMDSSECYAALKESLNNECKNITEENDLPLKPEDCDVETQKLCNAFTQAVAHELKGKVQCKYGDIMKLKPQGKYSNKVQSVKASHDAIKAHMDRANKYKHCFEQAGRATGVQPALIAAIASRESLVYSTAVVDEKTGISKIPGSKEYGMMQCHPSSGLNCTKYGPDSCEHVQQMIEELLVKDIMQVRRKFPKWTEEQQLQGGVAAYNFGIKNVQTWVRLDVGSTGNDFSGDVIARAQYLICTEGWKYCNEVCLPAKGRLPAQSTLQKHYPSSDQLQDAQLLALHNALSSAAAADALRVCHMLNSIPGHRIDHRATGSKVAENGMVYYYESRKVRLYLDDRYGFAEKASSVSAFNGKPGILFAQYAGTNNGIMGLWDGKKVLYIDDFSKAGTTFFLWSTATDCKLLAETGNCEFYMKCAETRLQCGDKGYPQAYGYKFCNKFSEFYDDFTDKGKAWVDKVRACLMTKLFPVLTNPTLTCKKLTEVAFKSHVKCYVHKEKNDDTNFCKVIAELGNWDALAKVFTSDLSPFFGPDWDLSWGQVLGTLNRCLGITAGAQFIKDAFEDGIKMVHDMFSSTTWDEEVTAECSGYANAGNCKFYECFEKRFRCKRVHGFSYLLHFELPSCLEFNRKAENFNPAGQKWLTDYQKCLMGKLHPLYLSEEVNCAGMGYLLKQHRATCMLEAGFCGIINDNQWFIELATQEYGYPLIERRRGFTLPISGTPDSMDNFYYRELDHLQRDIAYARKSCTGALASDPDVCVKRYSPVTKRNMIMKNPDL